MDAACTSTIRRAMRKVEDVILLRRKKACRLAGHSDYSVPNSTSYAMTFELVDSVDTFCLQPGRVTLVMSSSRGAVCTLAYHLGRDWPLWRRSNAGCRPASVARAPGMAKQERSLTQTVGRDVYVCLPDLGLN
jgi:hypothetical protein